MSIFKFAIDSDEIMESMENYQADSIMEAETVQKRAVDDALGYLAEAADEFESIGLQRNAIAIRILAGYIKKKI